MRTHGGTRKPGTDLRSIVEAAVEEGYGLKRRGLWFCPTLVHPRGRPLERLEVWGILHFPPSGSPFCCTEPSCHLGTDFNRPEVTDRIRHALRLKQVLRVEQGNIAPEVHAGVQFRSP